MTTDDVVDAEWLEESADDSPNVPAKYSVTDAASANWLVRRIVETRSYADRVRAWAAIEVRRAEREERFFIHYYGSQLEQWTRAEIETLGGRRRSICLPGGTVGFRRSRARLLICDEAELLRWCHSHLVDALTLEINATGADACKLRQWCRTNCSEARINESVSRSGLDQYFRSTGEYPQGTEITSQEKFFIK